MYACIYRPAPDAAAPLTTVAAQFSPRYEQHRDDLVTIDLDGLERLFGDPRTIGEELRRTARAHQLHVHVAIAGTRSAAMLIAHARPGLTVVAAGNEPAALAPLPVQWLLQLGHDATETAPAASDPQGHPARRGGGRGAPPRLIKPVAARQSDLSVVSVFQRWGIRTLGELAALPSADLSARLGQGALAWQALARGEDARPLVPTLPDERFESMLELEWPIEGLEPLSFVLTRLLEPLIVRLERRDRGAAAIVTTLRLVSRETDTRRLELPTPLRDVRALRTLVLLDLDSHPPGGAIDVVTITLEPTPGRILQHTLFSRPTPTPEQLSTLVARLNALMGQDRVGAPAVVDTYRPGAFAMKPFATDHDQHRAHRTHKDQETPQMSVSSVSPVFKVPQILRRCREPVPARVAVEDGRPVRVATDRRGYGGGRVARASGPWRVSGEWWEPTTYRRDEWDVELADGTVYRVFRDEFSERWFVDAIFD